jgi:DNA-binding response OmpR family regulator
LNVLIIEDDPQVGELLVQLLEKWKMDSVLVADCDEARTALLESSVDMLVSDLVLNGTTSLELIQELRASERHENLPILMVSAHAGKPEILAASQAGVDGFLAKPFDPPHLQKKIFEVRRTRLRQEQDRQMCEMWQTRTTYVNNVDTPHIIFGEAIRSEEELVHPSNKEIKNHLVNAWGALKECNDEQQSLEAGHVIESKTTDIVLHVKKQSALEWVRAMFLSCHCSGNVTVIARILRMNRGETLPIYLIYDDVGELPESEVKGLKKLGIKIGRRQKMSEKMNSLIRLHLTGKSGKKAEKAKMTALTPSAVKGRVIADIETMTKLPPLPQVYEKITQLARDQQSDMKDWSKVIELEPMTSATILKHANSSALGFTAEVTNIERAVVLLGKNTVAGLVAGEPVRKSFTAVEENGFKLEEFWLHNIAVDYTSHLLSLDVDTDTDADAPRRETIATAGLDEEAVEVLQLIDLPSRP